ncbi:unnamed protein product [Ranitomeya imitator]|uniref:Islet cell autoantigen Ica1 C-terminal domain-containing protein n=1 Tax=Ranitomeya imitator TaxID=111125 RepID=A0ABN9L822_9NEOB|nr:unnamed protein product [Ranitomeya imitator]
MFRSMSILCADSTAFYTCSSIGIRRSNPHKKHWKSAENPQSLQDPVDKLCHQSKKKPKAKDAAPEMQNNEQLISLDEQQQHETESESSVELDKGNTFDGTLDDLLDLKAEEKFIFEESATSKDPLADPLEADTLEKDEMQLLNEILSASSLDTGDLGKEWDGRVRGAPLQYSAF